MRHAACKYFLHFKTTHSTELTPDVFCNNSKENSTTSPTNCPLLSFSQYSETADGIRESYAGVPCKVVDCSKSDLETFAEICEFVEEVAAKMEEGLGAEGMKAIKEMVRMTAQKIGGGEETAPIVYQVCRIQAVL